MKKIIGLTCQNEYRDNKWIQMINQDYITVVEKAGAIPVILPVGQEDIEQKLSLIDGLIIIGGVDIQPQMYNEEDLGYVQDFSELRDKYEKELIDNCIKRSIPILGICRGMQMINVALGGTLYQDNQLYTNHPPQTLARNIASHQINIEKGSFLYTIFGEKTKVNSFHHQSVKDIGKQLKISAMSDDGVIEAFEHISLPIYGVQWHPESMHENNQSMQIFDQFIRRIS
ncbi:MAG: gamma-glutamyl-gamma-aminobutyrate hydrolase family protein [Coprobacillus sp.]